MQNCPGLFFSLPVVYKSLHKNSNAGGQIFIEQAWNINVYPPVCTFKRIQLQHMHVRLTELDDFSNTPAHIFVLDMAP